MAKKKTHIDQLFKQGLSNSTGALNGAEWDRIMEELHPPKKKKFLWWWFVVPMLFLGAAIGIYQFGFRPKTNAAPIMPIENQSIVIDENQKAVKTPELKEVKSQELTALELPNTASKQIAPKKVGKTKKPLELGTYSPNIPVDTNKRFNYKFRVDLLPKQLQGIGQQLKYIIPGVIQILNKPKIDKPKFVETPVHYVELSISQIAYNQTINSTNSDNLRYRALNEAIAYKPTIMLKTGAEWGGFDLQGGVGFTQKGQSLNSKFTYQLYDSIRYVDMQGNVTYIPWNYRDTFVSTSKSDNPKYSFITIPISVGKSFALGNNLKLGFGLNGQLQYLLKAHGQIIGESNRPLYLSANNFNRLNFSFGGYAEVVKTLNLQYDIGLRVNATQDISNLWKTNNVTQKFTGYGAGVMIRKKLY